MLPVSYCLTCCYLLLVLYRPPPSSPLFPYTTLFRSLLQMSDLGFGLWAGTAINDTSSVVAAAYSYSREARSEEHTSELQSRGHLVCRLLLEKKKHADYSTTPQLRLTGPLCYSTGHHR